MLLAMAHLISCLSVGKAFGARPLFTDISLGISEGQRIGLIGPNGSGKSTLVKILAGLIPPDNGEVATRKGLRLGYVPQEPDLDQGRSIRETVLSGLDDTAGEEYEKEARTSVVL